MKNWFPIGIILTVILLLSGNLSGGSVLSSRGVGSPYAFPTSRSMGMGGLSIAQVHPYTINRTNPAGLASMINTRLSIQYFMDNNRMEDRNGSASMLYSNFDGFSFVLPLGSGIGIATSLMPLTRINYKVLFENELENESYTKSLEGTGGLNTLDLSLYWAFWSKLSVGFTTHFLFGRIQETWMIEYAGNAFNESNDTFDTRSKGIGFTAGLVFRPVPSVYIGGIYSPSKNVDNRTEIDHTFKERYDSFEGSFRLPSSFGAGVSAKIKPYLLVGAEWSRSNWKELEFNDSPLSYTRNTDRISAGAEFFGFIDHTLPYLKRVAYRIGCSFGPYYTLDPSGNDISENWFTFGLGIPFIANVSQLDIAFGYGIRGALDTNGLSERIFRISVSITGGEKWFVSQF